MIMTMMRVMIIMTMRVMNNADRSGGDGFGDGEDDYHDDSDDDD